jgi:hypothetical protein
MKEARYNVYCPPQWRNRKPVYGCGSLAAMAEHSRPVYRVLDFAKLAKGNNPETPEHITAEIVADRLTYLQALEKAREMNVRPFAQKTFEAVTALRAAGVTSLEDAKAKLLDATKLLRMARNVEYMTGGKLTQYEG